MTNLIIKGSAYRLIDNKSFEIPLPLKYTLLKEDTEIAEYEISADESVSFSILTKYKENMITPINRPLTIADIYYFFSCRVFQDKTPFTASELSLLGLEKYNVFNIVRKTRGITPYDTYWIKFEGDDIADYDTARKEWDDIMSKTAEAPAAASRAVSESAAEDNAVSDIADISEILNQHKVNVGEKAAQLASENAAPAEEPFSNTTMSEDEIEKLLIQSGLAEAPTEQPEASDSSESSGGNMSPEDIAKLFAAADNAPTEEPKPAETTASSGGNMSPEDIAKLFAAADNAPTEEPKPAETTASSGGNMSPDDIAKLFAAADNASTEEPKPAETTASSGGNMSPDDIAKLFAAADNAPTEEPKPAETTASSGGNMSPDDIAKLFAAADNAPTEEPAVSDEVKAEAEKMGREDLEKMLSEAGESISDTVDNIETADSVAAEIPQPDDLMSSEDIEKMLNDNVQAVSEPADINSTLADDSEKLSPEQIEALLGDMKKDAQT